MKNFKWISLLLFLSAFLFFIIDNNFIYKNKNINSLKAEINEKEGEEHKVATILGRFEHEYNMTHDPATNTIPSERLNKARKIMMDKFAQSRSPIPVYWEERGPNNVGGRTRAVIFDANDSTGETVWAGGVGGGLWKTTNISSSNPNWSQIDDFFSNIAITTIAQSPQNPDNIFVGTGEGWFNGDAIQGKGIWRSTDGGVTWIQLSTTSNEAFDYVNKIIIDSVGFVFAATRSTEPNEGGIYRSINNGASWTRELNGDFSNASGADIEIAANGNLFASIGIGYSDGIYRSTNSGNNWTKIYFAESNENRIELACAPSNSDIIYAAIEIDGLGNPPLKKSMNGGDTWISLDTLMWFDQNCTNTSGDWTRGQDWYNMILGIDPNDANNVYLGGVDVFKSTNGGSSWNQISDWSGNNNCSFQYVHADHHAITFWQNNSNKMLFGNDGGVYLSTNGTANPPIITSKNSGYNVTQFYSVAVHPNSGSNYMLAGAQDNGTQQFVSSGINSTTEITGGDGGFCHIDTGNPMIQIGSYIYSNYSISTDGGNTWIDKFYNNNGQFINPTDYDSNSGTLYASYNFNTFFRYSVSTDQAQSFNFSNLAEGKISAVTVSPNINNRVYFGLETGDIIYIDNANATSGLTGNEIRTGNGDNYISSISVDKANEDRILVTFSSYGVTSVIFTTDGGSSWNDIEGDLPDMPVRWGIFNPLNSDQVFIATELGVWSTDNINGTSTDWFPTNQGLANVRVDMLKVRDSDNLISAATHGRGVFTTENSGCPITLQLNGTLESGNYQAADWINVTGNLTDNDDVIIKAGGHITFKPGFDNIPGAKIIAKIENCNPSLVGDSNPQNSFTQSIKENLENAGSKFDPKKKVGFLNQNFPNPFYNETTIGFHLPEKFETAKLRFSNLNGMVVRDFQLEESGLSSITLNSQNLSKGTYVYTLFINGNLIDSKKMVLLN